MNVSLSSNSATNKTSSLLDTGSASPKVEETGDSKGFFESFKEALGFEENDSKTTAKDADSASKSDGNQTSTSGDDSASVKSSSAEGEASSEVTKGDGSELKSADTASEAQTKQASAKLEAEKVSNEKAVTEKMAAEQTSELEPTLKGTSSSNPTDGNALTEKSLAKGEQPQGASQANAAMSEGNKLLDQLDEANKTLNQTPNGKGLPQQAQGHIAGASVAGASSPTGEMDKAAQQANVANQDNGLDVDSEIAVLTGGKGVSQLTDDEIRQLMDKGVTPEQIEASMSRELSQKNAASDVAAVQGQAISPADIELAKQVDAHTKALNQLNAQIDSEQSIVDGLLQKQQSGAKLSVDEQTALAKATSNLEVLNQQLTNVQQQANALLSQAPDLNGASGQAAAIDWDNTDSAEAKALAAVASTAAVATAAQQATSQMSSQAATNAVADKATMLHANNAHAAQQAAAQQLAAQQGNAASAQQAALDPSLTAQSLAMNAPVATTKAGATDMLLKAGAGTAALSGLGKAGAKEDSKESTLAQQIASAAGVQSSATAGSAPTRAE
ncbi:flagellar hook-length control protein FliK, partial [Vibrio lentus]